MIKWHPWVCVMAIDAGQAFERNGRSLIEFPFILVSQFNKQRLIAFVSYTEVGMGCLVHQNLSAYRL